MFQVPDYLCCKITLNIFQDPVIAPSGITYERAMIIKHLQKVWLYFSIKFVLLELLLIQYFIYHFMETEIFIL